MNGRALVLKGLSPKKLLVVNRSPNLKELQNAAQLCVIQVLSSSGNPVLMQLSSSEHHPKELQVLKAAYPRIFEDPSELPLLRGIHDHRIPLEPNTSPVNIRPYRYPLK